MKKILILYAKYGGGHLAAANSIQTYLEQNYFDTDIKIIDCIEYISPLLSKITTNAYKQLAKHAPNLWKKIYDNSQKGALSKISNSINKKMAKKLHNLFREFMPDIVISTHPFATQMTSYLKENENTKCILATILTDFASHDQWLVGKEFCDLYFVSNENMKNELLEANIPEDKIYITGIPLSNRFFSDFNKDDIYRQHSLDKEKQTILFFGGGEFGLGQKRTVQILHSLAKHLDNYQIIAISGKNKKMNNEFLKLHEKLNHNEDLHIYKYTTDVPELMHISSLVVTKPGGLTSSESLASGLPMLIINPIPGQEEQNAEFIEKSGAGIWLKKDDDIDETINNILLNPEKLKTLKNNSIAVGKKDSTKNICSTILEQYNIEVQKFLKNQSSKLI